MKPVITKTHLGSCILRFALCLLLILLSACAEGPDSSDEASSDTGSIAFSLAWEGTTSESTVLQAVDLSGNCEAYGVSWIKAEVLDENDTVIARGPLDSGDCGWPCTDGEGTITGVPVGDNRKVVVLAMDDNCEVLRQGESARLPVTADGPNDAGIIVLCLHVAGTWETTEEVDATNCGKGTYQDHKNKVRTSINI